MSEKISAQPVMLHTMKWIFVFGVLATGVVGNQYYADQPLVLRLLVWLLIAAAALFVASKTTLGQRAVQFASEAKMELRKVVWPTRQEIGQATMMVLMMVGVAGLFFWAVDALLLKTVAWLTGYGA